MTAIGTQIHGSQRMNPSDFGVFIAREEYMEVGYVLF